MNQAQFQRLTQFAESISVPHHKRALVDQLNAWRPVQAEPSRAAAALAPALQQHLYDQQHSPGQPPWNAAQPWQPEQQVSPLQPVGTPPAASPKTPTVKSQDACIKSLAAGDPEAIDILAEAYGWEVFDITRTLVALGPIGGDHLFVLPNDAEFVMGSIDAMLATVLFNHTPGQFSYRCELACRADRTGFAPERLKDPEFWRTRQLTRGNLVH